MEKRKELKSSEQGESKDVIPTPVEKEETGGFPDDVDFKKLMGCGG